MGMNWYWAKREDVDVALGHIEDLRQQISALSEQASSAAEQRRRIQGGLIDLVDRVTQCEQALAGSVEGIERIRSEVEELRQQAVTATDPVIDPILEVAARLQRLELQSAADIAEARQIGLALAERIELMRRTAALSDTAART
jgi:uncharacterized coiled-coil DUF342 family protein